ncbi:MAG: GNAT family N-acetyltransferase [Acidiferrobacteraceae bacterium]|nr:GNAT family N-acetyltransferase [Acidiferrobacteraceae bacterium]|tara:strand:+ start:1470 stop:2075 length:606 start_codon:yes stop_codon:yes gene_type:complete
MKIPKITNNNPPNQVTENPPPKNGILEVKVTYLEMIVPLDKDTPTTVGDDLMILEAKKPGAAFYRYLYQQVGRPWLWYERCAMTDEKLLSIIEDPAVAIYVVYIDGVPAGYAELDHRSGSIVELAYFGLIEQFIGHGIGSRFLNWILNVAWRKQPNCIRVNTCTLDHPKALLCYQNAGFTIYKQEVIRIRDPRLELFWPKN